MSRESSSPPNVLFADVGGRLGPDLYARKAARLSGSRKQEIRTNSGPRRTNCVRISDLTGAGGRRVTFGEPEAGFHFGDLGAAHGHAVRRRPVEFDHSAVSLPADKGDVRNRDNVAAM